MLPDGDGNSPVTLPVKPARHVWDLRIVALFFAAGLSLAAAGWVATAPAGLAFGDRTGRRLALDAAPEETLVAMKVDAASRRRFDIGVFGNSRSVALGTDDVGRSGCTFFNFSIPGSSFRSSVALLEILTDRGVAPTTAVVSLDHFELRMMGPPDNLPVGRLLSIALRDLAGAALHPAAMLRIAWRQTLAVWTKAKRVLSSKAFMAGIGRLLAIDGAGQVYNDDGSRSATTATAAAQVHPFAPGSDDHISTDLLEYDIERLAALLNRQGGPRRIILYESPLQPVHATGWSEHPSDLARNLRQATAAACSRLRLECHLGGMAGEPRLAAVAWPDASHAPPVPLGKIVSDFVGPRQLCESGPS